MRLLQRVVETPHPCTYLPAQRASLDVRLMLDVTPLELDALLSRGWRRFGPCYFRPQCAACKACVTTRVIASQFAPTRSQRRAVRLAAGLRRVVGVPTVDDARLRLYSRWHASREGARGWEESEMDAERYRMDFAFPHPCAREVAYYDGDRLVGLGLIDQTPTALSAAYFFYEPQQQGSLGVANVVHLVQDARNWGLRHMYLGYRVQGCASLEYKGAFRPHEVLVGRPAMNEGPEWRTA